jgi:hypothetical protein
VAFNQPVTKARQYGEIKTRIAQFKSQKLFPVDPRADGFSGIPVGQAFSKLEDGYNCEPPGRGGGLSSGRKERRKECVVKYAPRRCRSAMQVFSFGDGIFSDTHRLSRDESDWLCLEHIFQAR